MCAATIVGWCPTWKRSLCGHPRPDEARHVETFGRSCRIRSGWSIPSTPTDALLEDTLLTPSLGHAVSRMQVLIEGLALAAFGVLLT